MIVACFASHVHRVQQVLDAAVAHGRKVVYVGRSMVRNMGVARDLGYLNVPGNTLIELRDIDNFRPEEVVIISTGSQGEPLSALSRMANREHPVVTLKPGDTVVLASSLIPGNESAVYRVINGLSRLGAHVVHKGNALVHVSGHAAAGELLYCYNIVRPRNVMPVHGEVRHLMANGDLAMATGVPRERTIIAEDGAVIDLAERPGPGRRQGRRRLHLRRRQHRRRHLRDVADRPPDPGRGGVHLGDHRGQHPRLQDRQRSGHPRPRVRRG